MRLVGAGFRVFAGVRRDEDADRLRQMSDRVVPVRLDLTEQAHIEEAARVLAGDVGESGLAAVVNNAGIAVGGPLEFLPLDALRRQIEVNVVGQVAVTQAVLPMLRAARGRIVFVSSIAGRSALPFIGAYAASKHALEALADAWRVELAQWGIHVAVVEPGVIATPIWRTSLAAADRTIAQMPEAKELERLYGRRVAIVRKWTEQQEGLPADTVAAAVEHALTAAKPKTRYVIGRDAKTRLWLEKLPDRVRDRLIAKQLDGLGEG